MKISYKWLETYFARGFVRKTLLRKGLPSPEKLAEIFSAHAFEVEGVEKIATGTAGRMGDSTDTVFDIKVLPDRAHYALSHKGIAREASVLTGAKLVPANISAASATTTIDPSVKAPKVRVEEPKLCPRYMLRAIRDVAVGESPEWLRGRLEAVGARSINNIVDATNFVMLDLGQPLHAFDADKVRGSVTVRLAKPDEKITILDGREIALLPNDLLIADDEGPLAIAGTKGGKRAEVTAETKNLLIESANFNPTSVRKTSTRTNLRNDSSKRFENEITPALAAEAMDAVTRLIGGFSAGTSNETSAKISAISPITDVYPNPAKPWTVNVSSGFISSVIGQNVSAEKIKAILESEGCRVEIAPAAPATSAASDSADNLSITPPLDRLDLRIPEDIADEIARIMGYDKLLARETPDLGRAVPIDPIFYYSEQIKNILTGLGFSEVQTYSLVPKGAFEISYPLASDKAALRESVVPKLREAITSNSLKADLLGLQDIQMFEIGKVFPKTGEKTVLAIGAAPIRKKKGVTGMSIVENALKVLQEKLGVSVVAETKDAKGDVVEMDLDVIVSKMPKPRDLAELNFKPLPQDKKYVPFSAYPFIVRDIAMFVPSGTDEGAVISTIKSQASELLVKGPDLFDKFEKDGRISYAFRMIFQSFERTLSDEEINAIMSKVYDAVKSRGWEVR